MAQDGTRQYKAWVELAGRATKETDPEKLMRIIEALCRALDEQETIPAGGSRGKSARSSVDS
jgi:hypothetical protein